MKRCSWCSEDELYKKYHDCEWGVPVYDDRKLFEFLILEGAQAGLSWITILKKRKAYREAFCDWDFEKVAKFGEEDMERLMLNEGIVRNRLKILSAVRNAKVFIKIRDEFGSFSKYLWEFVDGNVVRNNIGNSGDVPVKSELPKRVSKNLTKRGMNFVGPTIIYAFLQAVGVVDDHEAGCFCRKI